MKFYAACVRFSRFRPYCRVKGGEGMEDILDQNREAERIFRQYGKLLTAVAAAQLPGRPEDAEECVQDAVWAFVEGREKWDPERGSEKTWLCLLLRSRARDRRRALASRAEEPLEDHAGLTAGDEAEGAAEQEDSLLIQGEPLSMENRENLFLIEGAYQRDGVLTVPLDVLSRSETPGQVWDRQKFRVTVYDSDGEELTGVTRTSEGELVEISNGGRIESLHPLGDMRTWLSQTYCPQGYASADSVVSLVKLPQGEMGPYTFEVEAYSTSGGWGEVLWSGTLTLDTPLAVDATRASREIGMGTVSALVGEDGRGVAFHAVLAPQYAEAGDRLCQLVVPEVWFIDESGNRHQSYMRRYTWPEDYMPELRMAAEQAGEIVAIEVDCVEYSTIHGDGREQSYPVYDDLNWVIELPR